MRIRFIYAGFQRHAEAHPELRSYVPCNEYLGPPSLGIASIAAATPAHHHIDFRDDRLDDVGFDDALDLVAISCFTPSAKRAMEIADGFRARGTPVVMGGIFPTVMPDLVAAHADAVVVGEGDGVWRQLLLDLERGELKPRYRGDSPYDLSTLPMPRVDLYLENERDGFRPDDYPVQLSRGCPLRCSACVLPVSMGRTLRPLPLDHVMGQIDQLNERGKLASFTEDTSFFPMAGAQQHFSALLEAMIARGREGQISYVGISMPMVLASPASLFDRMRRAGIRMFYLVGGFDPVTRNAFTGKDEKALSRAMACIAKCHDHGLEPYTSFLVGNDDDDEGTFDRMLEFANASQIRKAEFAIRTPYPGTPTFDELTESGRILHHDWSKYNDANAVFRPMHMTPERLEEGYLYLWREFYRTRMELSELGHRENTIQF